MLATYDAERIAAVLGLDLAAGSPATAAPKADRLSEAANAASHPARPLGLHEERTPFVGADMEPVSAVSIEIAVEDGLPRAALRHVAEWLAGDDSAKAATFEWAVVPKTTLERRTGKLSIPESERTERIARLAVQARRALGTDGEARAFMTAPHPELDGRAPVEAARTDLGGRRVEHILLALEYGLAL